MIGTADVARRSFLQAAGGSMVLMAGGGVLGAAPMLVPPAGKKLRVLMLGGTGFLGPEIVKHAIARGHEVTLFNRGKTNPDLFKDLETIIGDRYGDLEALRGREWDVVVDTFTYVPDTVRRSAELLAPNVKQYIVLSTISVYAALDRPDMDEDAPLAQVPPDVVEKIKTHREVGAHYGGMKALCEQAVEAAMPGRVTNIRPGLIVGPGDPTGRFTWWPDRVRRGGEVLSPGDPGHFTQFVFAPDLGRFVVTCAENGVVGRLNADRAPRDVTMGRLLKTSREVSGSDATFTWVEPSFLRSQGVQGWSHLPAWIAPEGSYAGFGQLSVQRAVDAGLTQSPLETVIGDTLAWLDTLPAGRLERLRAGLIDGRGVGVPPELEERVLTAWAARQSPVPGG